MGMSNMFPSHRREGLGVGLFALALSQEEPTPIPSRLREGGK